MKKELKDQLVAKYPKIFSKTHPSVGDGWYDLIDRLCMTIQAWIDSLEQSHKYAIENNELITSCQAGDFAVFNERMKYHTNPEVVEKYRQRLINGEEPLMAVPPEPKQVVAVQVKEKFGGLRFYIDGGDSYAHGVIDMAERMSYKICEICGQPGRVRGPGWHVTVCEQHARLHDKWTDEQLDRLLRLKKLLSVWNEKFQFEEQREMTEEEKKIIQYDMLQAPTEESLVRLEQLQKAKE